MTSITSHADPSTPVELNVNDSGGDGRPVVLIHGWPLSAESWANQVPALRDAGYRVVSYDRRGFGASDKPNGGYDYDTMAGDLAAVIDDLDLQRAALVGFSMGGGEVARYIGRFGTSRLAAAVFASAVPPFLLTTDDNPDGGLADSDVKGMKSGLSDDRDGFYEQFSRAFYTADDDLKVDESDVEEWCRLAEPGATNAALACIDAFSRTDFRADLTRVDVPTLVLHGASDAIVPFEVSGQRTDQIVSDSTLVTIEHGPHGINVSHPREFNSALLEFLDSLD